MVKYIAIQGNIGSGKDTVTEMLQYLLSSNKMLHSYCLYKSWKKFRWFKPKYTNAKYASSIKKSLSIILNVDEKLFENRDFKENFYVDLGKLTVSDDPNLDKWSDCLFYKNIKKNSEFDITKKAVKIRHLMQYFGTNIMRKYFGDNIWVNSVFNNKYIIISDQRFKNEYLKSRENGAYVIHLLRGGNNTKINHSSEQQLINLYEDGCFDLCIINNGTLKDLFFILKQNINEIKNYGKETL